MAGCAFVAVPGVALVVRAPWSDLAGVADDAGLWTALRLSLVSSTAATVLAMFFGVPLGWVLARGRFRGRGIVRALALLPLALPPVVAGLALLLAFGRRGVLGDALEAIGVVLPFTLWATVLAQAFVALPFVVLAVEAGVRGVD
ncbi:MAG TPA: molybdate ABC transporter permease subunit, partial [Acidimicrobiia bacterium]|nr:molybdate ABC transporter permease subunit [Acidimicrobiia bacterium]